MKVVKLILLICLGVVLGIAGHMAWLSLLNPSANVSGILQWQPNTHPAVSASHPAGFYVESRVYLTTGSQEQIGHTVSAAGTLSLTTDPDAPSYPKIDNKKVTIPRQKVAIENLTLQELETFINKHADELLASFGPPSRRHPAKHAIFWEYRSGQRFVVFLIRDKDQTVAGVNAGTDERKVYERWDSVHTDFEQAWVMSSAWCGEMGVAIALSPDRYYYWFYSDVKLDDEPEYPIIGSYSFVDGKLLLNGSNSLYYATNWIVIPNGGRKCLSAERDIGDVARYLIPDGHFDPSRPFDNQGTLKAEPTNAPYSSTRETQGSKR